MRKIVVLSFISLDGVMQAPGGSEADINGVSNVAAAHFHILTNGL